MSHIANVLSKQAQPGLQYLQKGGLVEGSKAEEAMDKKQGVQKKKCGGKVKK